MYSHVIFIFPLVCASLSGFVITTAIPQTNINSRHMTLEDYDTTTSLCVFLYARAKEMWFINPRRACERGLQYFVCLSVCLSVCLYVCLLQPVWLTWQLNLWSLDTDRLQTKWGCLTWAHFARNVSFKSYAAIHLPWRALVGHILVWEWVHVPWSGILGVLRVQWSIAADCAPPQLLVWESRWDNNCVHRDSRTTWDTVILYDF